MIVAGAGYLGRHVLRLAPGARGLALHAAPPLVTACDLGDLPSLQAWARSLPENLRHPEAVIHCASSGRGGAEAYRRVFVDGCRNLLETFPESRLLFTSSTSVYHQTDGQAVTEESPTEPGRETSRLLLEAEKAVTGSGGTVVRLAGLYGPGRDAHLEKLLAGTAVIEDGGGRIVNRIHRDDAARALLHLAALPGAAGEIFNATDNRPLTQRDLYAALAEKRSRPLPPEGPRPQGRKRAWTSKRVSAAKLLATGWTTEK